MPKVTKTKEQKGEPHIIERDNTISLKGLRTNNLKNIDLDIPRGKLVVVTGVSGSGKSSLAFDTLYAEGQRRYVESLSSYARQFLGRMAKPECDWIRGLPPAIAIEQRVVSHNPRSTVGTSTEIYEYLRLLYARIGHLISPSTGEIVKKHNVADITDFVASLPIGSRIYLLVSLKQLPAGRSLEQHLEVQLQQGYNRVFFNDKIIHIEELLTRDVLTQAQADQSQLYLLIDRLVINKEQEGLDRLGESTELAFFEGHGECTLFVEEMSLEGERKSGYLRPFNNRLEDSSGRVYQEPSPEMFSFNNPIGACPSCEGFGQIIGLSPELIIPNPTLSVYEDAVAAWKGTVSSEWKKYFIKYAEPLGFPIHRPYNQLTPKEMEMLWEGVYCSEFNEDIGINPYFKHLQREIHKVQNRVRLANFRGKTRCPQCHGQRLNEDALSVRIGGKNITDITELALTDALTFFETLTLSEAEFFIAKRLLHEIKSRLSFLIEVGLGYLRLDRLSNTLSGGESQRVTLATQLGSSLVGSLYVLDEPSIGLHQRDTSRLIGVVKRLRDLGNTVVVVEHDEEMMRASDYIIDIGPEAGRFGGNLIYSGLTSEITQSTPGHTAAYLTGREQILVPSLRRPWNNYIEILGANKHNLKGIDIRIPLNIFAVITGVSGSGKSTLIREVFYENLRRYTETGRTEFEHCTAMQGDYHQGLSVEYVDQNSFGRNSRSNPAIYIGAFEEIRELFSRLPLSKQMRYKPYYFSFNKEGGRCESCKGDGFQTIPMQFMADITILCEECKGKRFRKEILDVSYHGKNIYEILELSVDEAIEFFTNHIDESKEPSLIVEKLLPLQTVGLGYIKLGQPSSTLSGGENQRVKLAYYLARGGKERTLFIFDEPTTGLHFHDIKTLLKAFQSLVDVGHSLVVVEHNMEVIKSADWVIDLGPEGGEEGGRIVAQGTPEEVAQVKASWTGRYLAPLVSP